MKYISDTLRMTHKGAEAQYRRGRMSHKEMAEMDILCLTPEFAAAMKRDDEVAKVLEPA